MLLAHISDTHFKAENKQLYDFIDVNAINARVVNKLNSIKEKPDAIVITGDIVNSGSADEYLVAKRIISYLDYPVYIIPGNHDDKQKFIDAFSAICPQIGSDPNNIRYAIDDYPVRLLFIDSSLAGESKGYLTAETLAWLQQQMATTDKECYVFLHHPPVHLGNLAMDRIYCENGAELLKLVDQYPNFSRIFCGHVHRTILAQYKQALIMSVYATAHQVPYLNSKAVDCYSLEAAPILMHRLVENTGLVSYCYSLDMADGPFLYSHKISYSE